MTSINIFSSDEESGLVRSAFRARNRRGIDSSASFLPQASSSIHCRSAKAPASPTTRQISGFASTIFRSSTRLSGQPSFTRRTSSCSARACVMAASESDCFSAVDSGGRVLSGFGGRVAAGRCLGTCEDRLAGFERGRVVAAWPFLIGDFRDLGFGDLTVISAIPTITPPAPFTFVFVQTHPNEHRLHQHVGQILQLLQFLFGDSYLRQLFLLRLALGLTLLPLLFDLAGRLLGPLATSSVNLANAVTNADRTVKKWTMFSSHLPAHATLSLYYIRLFPRSSRDIRPNSVCRTHRWATPSQLRPGSRS